MNRLKPCLRHLPTTEELQEISLSRSERKRRALGLRSPIDKVHNLGARLLERRGPHASTCAIWHINEAVAEAKRRLGITCSLRAYISAARDQVRGIQPP